MSFIASASDSLISPVNAVNGQTLTWNATTGQFEPTTPTSGDTPELLLWAANTAYSSGDTVSANLISPVILRKVGAGTSSATLDATELASWRYFGQSNFPVFLASSLVCTNFVISQGGQLWQSISNRVTGATFDVAEQTNWVALTSTPTNIGGIASTTTINGIVKKPNMAYLKTNAAANTVVAANTNTIIAFTGGVTNGTGVSLAASTFTITRTGFYSIRLKVSFQSATTNVRGIVFLSGSTAIFAGVTPQKAFRTPATANANEEIEAAWDLQVTNAGNFTVQISASAAGTVNLNNGATATAATTEITILEIG